MHLSVALGEINTYGGVGTENNHINKYTQYSQGTAYDWSDDNHTGEMAYYTSETSGYVNGLWINDEFVNTYENSDIKYVVDDWAEAKFTKDDLKIVNGYKVRLVTSEEYEGDLTNWLSNSANSYGYWTMSPGVSSSGVWAISNHIAEIVVYNIYGAVRPVINVYKSAIHN